MDRVSQNGKIKRNTQMKKASVAVHEVPSQSPRAKSPQDINKAGNLGRRVKTLPGLIKTVPSSAPRCKIPKRTQSSAPCHDTKTKSGDTPSIYKRTLDLEALSVHNSWSSIVIL